MPPAVKHHEAQANEEHPSVTRTPVDPVPVTVEGEGRTDRDPPPSLSIKGETVKSAQFIIVFLRYAEEITNQCNCARGP